MKKVLSLVLVIVCLFALPAHAAIWAEDFTRQDFVEFTMLVPDGWEYGEAESSEGMTYYFASDVHKASGGFLLVYDADASADVEISTEKDAVMRYERLLMDIGVKEHFYRDFYQGDTYCWFWAGDFQFQGGASTYDACGFVTFRDGRDYFMMLLKPDSNGLNNSWRMNTMIDSIEWIDQA